MADTPKERPQQGRGAGTQAPGGDGADEERQRATVAPITVNAQYIKDLSFESPKSPHILARFTEPPQISVNFDVSARGLAENTYEVLLGIQAEATLKGETAFITELTYGGVFTLQNIPAEHLQPVLLIECPRLLFPFARNIVAEATREGGFPPLMINPIDFADLYRRRAAQQQSQAEQDGPGETSGQA